MKIREDTKAKEENLALAEQEHAKRESAKANAERRLEEIRQKTEVESRCFKDDIKRLEDELARLQKSMGVNHPTVPSTHPPGVADRNSTRAPKQPTNQRPSPASNKQSQAPTQKASRRRDCVICKREEACVILLQCAHQVLCVGCNKRHEEKGVARCPCCNAKVEERIRVFGASSNWGSPGGGAADWVLVLMLLSAMPTCLLFFLSPGVRRSLWFCFLYLLYCEECLIGLHLRCFYLAASAVSWMLCWMATLLGYMGIIEPFFWL